MHADGAGLGDLDESINGRSTVDTFETPLQVLFNAAQFEADNIPGVVLLKIKDCEVHTSAVGRLLVGERLSKDQSANPEPLLMRPLAASGIAKVYRDSSLLENTL
jgi:hypothetical protein